MKYKKELSATHNRMVESSFVRSVPASARAAAFTGVEKYAIE